MTKDDPYDVLANSYASHSSGGPSETDYELPALLAALGDQKSKKVLDLGCGPGPVAAALVRGGADVVGVDRSAAMVDIARSSLGARAHFLRHDLSVLPLPFDDSSFDTVAAGLVLHYLSNWAELLIDLHRILRPRGRVVASIHHPFTDRRRRTLSAAGHAVYSSSYQITDRWELGGVSTEVRFWHHPLNRIAGWLTQAGFVLTDIREPYPSEYAEESPHSSKRLVRKDPACLIVAARREHI